MASATGVEMMRRPQSGVVVLGVEPRLHARFVVGRRDQPGECLARLVLEIAGKAVTAPGLAHRRRGAGNIAAREQRPRQCKATFGGVRRLGAEEIDDGQRVDVFLPHHRFGPPPQRLDARPARIGGDECGVARKIGRAVFAVQDHPFHELARDRIGNSALDVGRFALAALAARDRWPASPRTDRAAKSSSLVAVAKGGAGCAAAQYRRLRDRLLQRRIRRRRRNAEPRAAPKRPQARSTAAAGRFGPGFCAPGVGVSALPSFSPLTAGRCRGKGTCPDGGAACASAVRTQMQARSTIVRKPGTFPPGGRVADCSESLRPVRLKKS